MKTFTITLTLILLTIQNLAAYEGELRFFIDDNNNEAAYTIMADRLSNNDPLFGINFMEVDTDLYNNVICTFSYSIPVTNDPPWDFYLGFDFVRDQGSYHFPFIGEGKYQISIFRDGLLKFRFKIDLIHHDSVPPHEGVDIDFYYRYSTGEFIVVDVITKTVAFDEMLYSWVLKNQDQDLTYFVRNVELTNLIGGVVENNIKTTFNTAVMGFPDPNTQTGVPYNPGTVVPLWRGVYYNLSTSHTTYIKNGINYNFRNWNNYASYASPTTLRVLAGTNEFRSMYYPTHPLLVANYLEGATGGNFQLTWQNPPQTQTWQFGDAYNAFSYDFPNYDLYSIEALTPFQYLGTIWDFHKWNDGSTNNIKSNLQIIAPTSYTAYYKGIQRSDDQDAYVNNSQRKFVRTDDGILHNVYCSMGRVFYEISSNSGVTWQLANNGQPLDNGEGKFPSIDYSIYYGSYETYYQVFIVLQEKYGSSSKIKVKYFQSIAGGIPYYPVYQADVGSVQGSYYSTNTTPVIGVNSNYFTVVWKGTGDLYARAGHINIPGGIVWDSGNALTGTYSTSVNPTISFSKTFYSHQKLAWEDQADGWKVIKYATLSGSQISGSITTPSTGSGFSDNYSPSIVQFMNASRLCWVGSRWVSDPINEEDGFPQTKVLFKAPESTPSRFWQFGNNVSGPNINRKTGDDTYYAFAWYESSGQSKFADNTLSTIRTITDVTGQNLQISNGPNKDYMFCMSFNKDADVPLLFQMSDDLGSFYTMEKITYYAFNSGREGIISVDSAEFYFAIGDMKVDDQQINFKEIEDSIQISTLSVLNDNLITDPFEITDNSSFIYSVQYGINDSVLAVNALTGNQYVNFIVKLIDENTGEILSEFDNITYNSENVYKYNNITYQVNTQGLGNRLVRLKLIVDNNFNSDYSLSKIYSDESVLGKINFKEINISGNGIISTYDLFQNYPNPFNPSTNIKYQLPKDGIVTLKVYDILGAELATLVNEQKLAGKYEANFNASSLASGVYVYRLQANEYISVKKMVLIR